MRWENVDWPAPTAAELAGARVLSNGDSAVTGPGGTAVLPRGTPASARYMAALGEAAATG